MRDVLTRLSQQQASLDEQGLLRRRRCITPLPDAWCEVDGNRLRNFASNDYLNLARDPRVIAAARTALETAGVGATASALICGRTDWHARLEEQLARFERQPTAVLFPTGYAANLGTIPALVGPGDVVFCDRLNHASLIDGCRLSGAKLRVYRHENLTRLGRELKKHRDCPRRLIVSDSLFSMDGHVAPLPELCDLADRYDAALCIDEAHATGVFGPAGRGVAELLGVEERIDVRIGTLSKALGALGGFVAGPSELTDWLWNRSRPQMFSTALPPSACAAASAAILIVVEEPWRRERLRMLSQRLREKLVADGLETPEGVAGPIVTVILNEPERTTQTAEELENEGFLVAAIRPPTVPRDTSRLRITLSCAHTESDIDQLAAAIRRHVTPHRASQAIV